LLIDPNSALLRGEPRDARDLAITANNSWCLAYDNLSYVPPWLSDAFCRLSTGGGFATRELYTDQDEIIFDSKRPVLLTSIEEVATRSDAIDRCIIANLPSIPVERRRLEAELEASFNEVRTFILGALIDVVCGALRDLPNTHLDALPRMADFAIWVTAAERALGWPAGTFLEVYCGNRIAANELALESSLVGPPLLQLLKEEGDWNGTASELLTALEERVTDQIQRQKSWPKVSRSMTCRLQRLAPTFVRSTGTSFTTENHIGGNGPSGRCRKRCLI